MRTLFPALILAAALFAGLATEATSVEPKFGLSKGSGLYVADGVAAEPRLLFDYKDEYAHPQLLGFSPDGSSVVMGAYDAETRALIKKDPDVLEQAIGGREFHVQAPDGRRERIPGNGEHSCGEALFSPDGKRIALRYYEEQMGLWALGEASVRMIPASAVAPSEMEVLAWSPDSRSLWQCQARENDVIRNEPWKGWISRYEVREGESVRYADAPAEAPCLWSLIATRSGLIMLAAEEFGKAGRIAFAEQVEGKAPTLKLLAEPTAQELLPLPGGKAVAVHWDEAKAWLYDVPTQKTEALAKFDLKGMRKMFLGRPAHAFEIGGAPRVAFSVVTKEGTRVANLLLDLKIGEWREIFKGYDLERVWPGK